MSMINDINCSKSYATKDNLLKALKKFGYDPTEQVGIVVVRNDEGRWTAVFSFASHGVRPVHVGPWMTI